MGPPRLFSENIESTWSRIVFACVHICTDIQTHAVELLSGPRLGVFNSY